MKMEDIKAFLASKGTDNTKPKHVKESAKAVHVEKFYVSSGNSAHRLDCWRAPKTPLESDLYTEAEINEKLGEWNWSKCCCKDKVGG